MSYNCFSNTTHENSAQSCAAVRAEYDKLCLFFLGNTNNLSCWISHDEAMFKTELRIRWAYLTEHFEYSFRTWLRKSVIEFTTTVGEWWFFDMENEELSRRLFGEAQWAWLLERLREPAALRIVVSSIQVLAEGHGWEAWRLFPRERARLLELLGGSAAPVVILSGDRHRGGLYQYPLGPDRRLVEMTSSSLNFAIPGIQEEPGPLRVGPTFRDENFGSLSFDWAQRHFELALFDRDGLILTSYHGALFDSGG